MNVFSHFLKLILLVVLCQFPLTASELDEPNENESQSEFQTWQFANSEQRTLFNQLSHQLACPECAGASLAESNSPIASSLRNQLYLLVLQDQSEEEIVKYFHNQYGGKVILDPQGKARWLLLLSIAGVVMLALSLIFLPSLLTGKSKTPTNGHSQ